MSLTRQVQPLAVGAYQPGTRSPLLQGSRHYVPILKLKTGEIDALQSAGPSTWDRMTPLLEVVGPKGSPSQIPDRSSLPSLAQRVGLATGANPFFLDVHWLRPRTRVRVGRGGQRRAVVAVQHILGSFMAAGLPFVPVVRPADSPARRALIARIVRTDDAGVALRLPLTGIAWRSAEHVSEVIDATLGEFEAPRSMTDLILDMGYIEPDPGFEAADVVDFIEMLPDVHLWRSLVLAGTSMPSTLTGFAEQHITEVPRHEWRLWNEVRDLRPPRTPAYGDFGVQHPTPPSTSGPGMRANIRYTTTASFLVARGQSVLEFGSVQYKTLSQWLVARSEYRGATFSWGDQALLDCANGLKDSSSQHHWRGVGTSHHLRHVTDALQRI